MSLLALLESSKQVALEAREEVARRNAEEIADFEEHGADLVRDLALTPAIASVRVNHVDSPFLT